MGITFPADVHLNMFWHKAKKSVSNSLKHALILVNNHVPMIHQSDNKLQHVFLFISKGISTKIMQRHAYSCHFIFVSYFMGTHDEHTFRNFSWSCIIPYAEPHEHPIAVATMSTAISLSALIIVFLPLLRRFFSNFDWITR